MYRTQSELYIACCMSVSQLLGWTALTKKAMGTIYSITMLCLFAHNYVRFHLR